MRVAYIGNFEPEHSTENDIRRSFEELGHEVVRLQENEVDFRSVPRIVQDTGSDFVLWTRTWALDQEAQGDMLAMLRTDGVPSVSIHLDRYWGLAREGQIRDEPWWRCDHVFTADGGNEDKFAAAGVRHYWMPPAVLAASCYRGTKRDEFAHDVVFVGSVRYHREWPWRRILVQNLSRAYRRRFGQYPRGRGRSVRGDELNSLYASARVVVGDSCLAGKATHYWSDRIPETLGRGGFLIHPEVVGLEEHFTPGEHLVTYPAGDFPTLQKLIDYYLRHDDERQAIAAAGMEHVKAHHTYAHRVQQLLDTLAEHDDRFRVWRGEVRPGTSDADVVDEMYREDVYRAKQHLREGAVVVDVGANVGVFSVWAAQRGAEVIAVEPSPANREQLERNVYAHNGIGERITLIAKAIAGEPGFVRIMDEHKSGGAWTQPAPEGVPTITLDEVIPADGCDFLKLDVEGAEFSAIEGATFDALRRCKAIAVEFHNEPMLDRAVPEGSFGRMVEKLGEVFTLEIIGRPSTGGYVYGRCL